jgi:glutamate:GABA antiporter
MNNIKKTLNKMSLLSLILVSSAFVTSVRNLTTIAETQMHMLFFGLIAAVCYFIPVALVSAELATGWPKAGGIYVWAKQAFGERWGFFTSWLQWIYCILGVISTLYFASDTIALLFSQKLAQSPSFLIIMSLLITWVFTFLNLCGQKTSSLISGICFSFGVFLPAVLIIALGITYLFLGHTPQINLSFTAANIFPSFKHFTTLVLLVGFIRAFGGIEAAASHANEVKNPRRNYPISIFIVVIIGLSINIFGSMSVAIVIPHNQISLAAGLLDAFSKFLTIFHLHFLTKPLALLIAIGAIGSVSTWLMGPIKGILATARNGDLPPLFHRINKKGAPSVLLIIQAILISIVTIALLMLPSINTAFWISVALAMTVYIIMYIMMLLSALVLRYKEPLTPWKYKIPFGNGGIWVVCILGIATLAFAFVIDFFPPSELPSSLHSSYTLIIAISAILFLLLPHIIFFLRKASWKEIAPVKLEESN